MKKINSLLYRELMLMKKGLIMHSFIIGSLMILAWLVMLSFKIGNLSFFADDKFTYNVVYNICTFMIAFLSAFLTFNTEVIESDLKSGWRRFSMSIPVSPAEKALVKTIIKLILTAAAFLIQLLNYSVISAITGRKFNFDYLMIFLLIIAVCLLADLITTAFMLAAKNEKAIALSNASPILLILPCLPISRHFVKELRETAVNFQINNPDLTSDEMGIRMIFVMLNYVKDVLSDTFVFIIPSIAIILAGGFIINAMILKRRDK